MAAELESLRIDRTSKSHDPESGRRRKRLAIALACAAAVACTAAGVIWRESRPVAEEQTQQVITNPAPAVSAGTLLNATGYIVAAHKIEVASNVAGKVAWIGVEKGNRVKAGQVLVRLEDHDYRAHVLQAEGGLESLEARLRELEQGSRPEEIAKAAADVDAARADLENHSVTLRRASAMAKEGLLARQSVDDAQGRHDAQVAKVVSLQQAFELARLGPRREQIDAGRAQVKQARGALAFAQNQLENTAIRAPVAGVILERNVEKGEFVTTGFVGDRGAKGYVVALADLNDLEVEVDISQNEFARLAARQPAIVKTDAYPDRSYEGFIREISPEANRQKATVQVKVKIENADEYLRPDMNASVSFLEERASKEERESKGEKR